MGVAGVGRSSLVGLISFSPMAGSSCTRSMRSSSARMAAVASSEVLGKGNSLFGMDPWSGSMLEGLHPWRLLNE